jgi:hypothetical protein
MTVPGYGRVTPLQSDMLGLGGEICRWYSKDPPSDEIRMKAMISSRKILRKITGEDFGYDLLAWHDYLLANQKHSEQYTFTYAWSSVKPKIEELIHDARRQYLVKLLESSKEN